MSEIEDRIRRGLGADVTYSADDLIGAAAAGARRTRRQQRWAAGIGAALAVLVVVAGVMTLTGGRNDSAPPVGPGPSPSVTDESPGPDDHPISTYDAGGALLLVTVKQWDEVGTATVWRKDPEGWRRIGALEHAVPKNWSYFPYFTSLHPGPGPQDVVAFYLDGDRVGYSSDGGATWSYLAEPRECGDGRCSYLHSPDHLYLDTQGGARRAAFGATSWETVRLPDRTASLASPLGDQLLSVELDCDQPTNHYWVAPDRGDSWSARRDFPLRTCLLRSTTDAAYAADANETQWWRSTDLVRWEKVPADVVADELAREDFGACPGSSGRDPAPGGSALDGTPVRIGDVIYQLFDVSEPDANVRELELRVSQDDCRTWREVLP